MRFLSFALLGLTMLAGCSNGRDLYDRSGRDVYNRSGRTASTRSYPASAKTTQGGQDRYRVCHNGQNTLTLPTSAVEAHLRHGDRFGTCSARRDDRRDDRNGRADRQDDRREDRRNGRRNGRGNGRGNGRN